MKNSKKAELTTTGFLSLEKKETTLVERNYKSKKAELTTTQLVGMIILIVSFGVILVFIFTLDLGNQSKKEVCRSSVLLAGNSPVKSVDCKTNYVCISGGDKCEDFDADETLKLEELTKDEIMKNIANELSDCWWMFGQGKVNFVSSTGGYNYHCGVCSIIKFDKTISDKFPSISKDEFIYFLEHSIKENSQSYSSYLYNTEDFQSLDLSKDKIYTLENIDLTKKYSVIAGINPEYSGRQYLVYPSIVSVDKISSQKVCDIFDITKG